MGCQLIKKKTRFSMTAGDDRYLLISMFQCDIIAMIFIGNTNRFGYTNSLAERVELINNTLLSSRFECCVKRISRKEGQISNLRKKKGLRVSLQNSKMNSLAPDSFKTEGRCTEKIQSCYESRFPKSNIISKYGFYSLYDDFIAAMEEAESYYDREGGYEEFKEKHPSLFFPETEDDYSAYLPVSDKEIAKLLNAKGEVTIAGKVVNLINVTSYNQLKELSVIPNDDTQWITLRNAQVSSLTDSQKVETRVTVLPEEFCNNRKLWINCSYKSSNTILVEVCFRKKGAFCKWYNYSSTTYLDLMFFEYGGPYIWYGGKEDGCSSHDVKHSRSTPSQRFIASGKVKFQGFGAECGDNW
ncbi:MAG: hypothetical protein LBC19_02260, partial [Tannerella sp.]|nr:hypothetical protein [Tannerella sp.]